VEPTGGSPIEEIEHGSQAHQDPSELTAIQTEGVGYIGFERESADAG
jgi:hypothetical protein